MTSKSPESGVDAFAQQLEEVPYYRFLGIHVRRYGRGEASLKMQSSDLNGPFGVVDEGPLLTLGSLSAQLAVMTLVGQGRSVIPLEQRLSLLRPTKGSRFVARAKIDHLRARIAQGRFRLYDEEDEMIATGGLIAYVLPREQITAWKTQTLEFAAPSLSMSDTDVEFSPPITFQHTLDPNDD